MSESRYEVTLSDEGLGDMVDVHLPDGRTATVHASGSVLISREGEFPLAGYANMDLPDPGLSAADHQGYYWVVTRTRRRHAPTPPTPPTKPQPQEKK